MYEYGDPVCHTRPRISSEPVVYARVSGTLESWSLERVRGLFGRDGGGEGKAGEEEEEE
jgi:hypothetical protein